MLNDCEADEPLSKTDHCVKFGCENAKLVKSGPFYVCPKCGASYGRNPHPKCK